MGVPFYQTVDSITMIGSFTTAGSAGGVIIPSGAPSTTTNTLYNVSGVLTWNGSPIDLTTRSSKTGFDSTSTSTLTFNTGTRVVTLAPTGSNFDVFVNGVKYTKTTQTSTIPNTTGGYFIYFDSNGTLQQSTTPWDILTTAPVAYVYWDSGLADGFAFEERHGSTMDPSTHKYLHNVNGTEVISGFAASGYDLAGAGGNATNAFNTFAIASGVIADEDIHFTTSALADGTAYTIFTRTGASGTWTWTKTNTVPYKVGTTFVQYNQWTGATWQMTEGASLRYINYFVFVSTSIDSAFQFIIIPGQAIHTSLANAQAETYGSLSLGTLPFQELAPLYQFTLRTGTGVAYNGASGSCRIEAFTRIIGTKTSISNFQPSAHNNLSGIQGGAVGDYYHLTAAQATIATQAATTTLDGYLSSTDWNTFNNKGSVSSVAMTVPTGLSIAGSPITGTGTLALTFTAGYSIPTDANQALWTTAYNDRNKWDGGATGLTASTGRTSLGATTVGANFFMLANPSAITFPRINADNTISTLDAATFRTAIGAGTSSTVGTVTSVTAGNGLTQSGTSTIDPTIDVVSHAGTSGAVGTLVIGANDVGVSLGTTGTTACAGNDSRLSDARTPTSHTLDSHTVSGKTAGQVLLATTATTFAFTAVSGDITIDGSGVTAIGTNKVTNAMAAQMAANTIKGNNTGSTANAADLTGTQITALLDAFTSGAKGLVPASGGGTTNFLRADGTFAAVPAGMTYTTVADAAYTITATSDIYVAYTSISTTRTVTLPAASGFTGKIIWVGDNSGSVTASVKITVACAGSDKIEGSTITSIDIQTPYGRLGLMSDGSKWIVLSRSRKILRWHFDGALATTTKQPYYSMPCAGRIMAVRHMPQTAGTGTIVIKVAGSDTYTITASSGNSITAYTSDSTTQTAVAADALIHCRCSTGGTEADVTVEVVVDEWTV